jgi:ribonuclease T1
MAAEAWEGAEAPSPSAVDSSTMAEQSLGRRVRNDAPTRKRPPKSPHGLGLVALCAVAVVAGGCTLARNHSPGPAASAVGVPTCPLTTLPAEVADTVRTIHAGGPFAYPRNDGVVFGNREGHLPGEPADYYHEYTVVTPGAGDRSTRRIVTGGFPLADPPQYFYTGDHYNSFCLVADAAR